MAAARCLYNSRAALYRVFVSPMEAGEGAQVLGRTMTTFASQHSPQQLWRHPTPSTGIQQQQPQMPSTCRSFSTSSLLSAPRPPRGSVVPDRLPIDFEIRDKMIMVIDLENKLSGPHNTQKLLKSIDTATYSLRMIQHAESQKAPSKNKAADLDADPDADPAKQDKKPPRQGAEYALCRLVDKKAEWSREQKRSKDKKASERVSKIKEVEINWAIAQNDLALKLRQMGGFLAKGHRVDVMFATKKGARQASVEEMERVVKAVKDTALQAPGGRERKESEGVVGKKLFLYLEAQPQKKKSAAAEGEAKQE